RYPETIGSQTLGPQTASRGPVDARTDSADRDTGRDPRTATATLPRIAAGQGLYARTMYAVDSDYPGPVLLEILEPPLAGAVVSGAFTLVGERLVLRLSRLEYRGRSHGVDAWAAGLDCACYGVGGEVDSHWFERVLLPSAVRFAEGFLTALSRPTETVTVGDGVRYERREAATRDAVHAGLATAARTAGDVLLENAPDGPTVRIARDTEMVVVFAGPPAAAEDGPDG
ncbi:MAG: DotG/IcmE/VirB10 family protein, partial [Alphaproteobacteria bacterium]|nr:DotG/IcmE/VirB10 family protein [Alphaproteobacteria bacterium]